MFGLNDDEMHLLSKARKVKEDGGDAPLKDFLDDDEIYECIDLLVKFADEYWD